jgi:hypothetical protein
MLACRAIIPDRRLALKVCREGKEVIEVIRGPEGKAGIREGFL